MSNSKKIPLKSTEHASLAGARSVGPTDPHQIIEISVLLKHRQQLSANVYEGKPLNHSDFAKMRGADPAHVDKIQQFARDANLQVLDRGDEVMRRTVTLAGTAAAMEKAFSIELNEFEHPDGSYRGFSGAVHLPEEYASLVQGVFGLDDRPVAKPHFRYRVAGGSFGVRASNTAYTPSQVAALYSFPKDASAKGQTIGIIELGGGFRPADIHDYFHSLGIESPTVKSISVDHANNRPSTPQSADGQVMLDIEVAGAVAPGASIAVYFAPNTERGFQDALSTAIHDQLHRPSVLSISWGSAEENWSAQSMECFDKLAREAAMLGISITAAAGDCGSTDGLDDGKNHVDFPASCPYVLATGGTRLSAGNGSIRNETAWNNGGLGGATGGGYSTVFARPTWQSGVVSQSGRGVPDVAGNADPETGYNLLVDGQQQVAGGTSAAAPLWAGLIALLNQKLNTRLGCINPSLYKMKQSEGFRDIISGSNGAYAASRGWNAVAGHGSPVGTHLMQALQGINSQSAGKQERAHAMSAGSAATAPASAR